MTALATLARRWSALSIAIAAVVAACAAQAMRVERLGDYPADAGPAIDALVDGRLGAFFDAQPLMGSFSLLLRLPFVLVSERAGGGELAAYQAGCFGILLAAGALGLYLATLARRRGMSNLGCALIVGLVLLNPLTFQALDQGHPEEILGATLCVAAVLAAQRQKLLATGLLLGLALATKQWAVLALGPVLVAATAHRVRICAVALALAAALTLPLLAGDHQAFAERTRQASSAYEGAMPLSIWRPFATEYERTVDLGEQQVTITGHRLPHWLGQLSHPLIVLLTIPLTLAYRRFGRRRPEGPLALLALLFLLRSVLDPVNNFYYHVPFLVALCGAEAMRRRDLPLVTCAATALLVIGWRRTGPLAEIDATALYLSWTLPLIGWLALDLFAPKLADRLAGRRASRPRVATAG